MFPCRGLSAILISVHLTANDWRTTISLPLPPDGRICHQETSVNNTSIDLLPHLQRRTFCLQQLSILEHALVRSLELSIRCTQKNWRLSMVKASNFAWYASTLPAWVSKKAALSVAIRCFSWKTL